MIFPQYVLHSQFNYTNINFKGGAACLLNFDWL